MTRLPAVGLLLAGGFALGAAPAPTRTPDLTVEVLVLSHWRPHGVALAGPEHRQIVAEADSISVDGRPRSGPLELAPGHWRLALENGVARSYVGALRLGARRGELTIVVRMDVEDYVGLAVAAETEPGWPPAALRAQAIVARSYALAGRRHEEADLCDLAHCQALNARGGDAHRRAARAAAGATRGMVLRLETGDTARAVFHAACGGTTADPRAVFGGQDLTGAGAVRDAGCPPAAWRAGLSRRVVESAATAALGTRGPAHIEDLAFSRDGDGRIVGVRDRATERWTPGDAFVRALDRAAGWGVVRSARFTWRASGDEVEFEGSGLGHGVGLCQAGAVRMAASGAGEGEILAHYFPRARLAAYGRLGAGADRSDRFQPGADLSPGPARCVTKH